nr:hypothetical protein [Tanacetum cinerariifolium]
MRSMVSFLLRCGSSADLLKLALLLLLTCLCRGAMSGPDASFFSHMILRIGFASFHLSDPGCKRIGFFAQPRVGIDRLHSLAYVSWTSSARPDHVHFLRGTTLQSEQAAAACALWMRSMVSFLLRCGSSADLLKLALLLLLTCAVIRFDIGWHAGPFWDLEVSDPGCKRIGFFAQPRVGIDRLHSLAYVSWTSSARPDHVHFLIGTTLQSEQAAAACAVSDIPFFFNFSLAFTRARNVALDEIHGVLPSSVWIFC